MLFIHTKLAPSSIHGIGLYAAEFIPKGRQVWKFVPGFDQEFPKDFPCSLSPSAQKQFLNYAYVSRVTGNFILCTDDMRFINNSLKPNIINVASNDQSEGVDIATRDIHAGEELFYDYTVFADELPT